MKRALYSRTVVGGARAMGIVAALVALSPLQAFAQGTPTTPTTPPVPAPTTPAPTTQTPTTPTPAPPAPTPPPTTTPTPPPPTTSPTPPTPAPPPTTTTPPKPAPTTPAPATPIAKTDEGAAITDEEEGPPKLSLPTEEDRQAWQKPGFRLSLGFTYGELQGVRGAPSGRLLGPILRIGLRLDADWSLMTSFMYAQASRSGGLSGLRFAGTVDPTWHVTPSLSLAFGFGFGGIVEGNNARTMDASPAPDTLQSSYTFPDASTPISSCSGVGAASLVRGEYATVMGPRSQFHVSIEVVGQWTGCVQDTGNLEPDTGQAIERRQWWPHVGGSLTAGFTWR